MQKITSPYNYCINNVQPEEAFSNSIGLFIDDYVQTVKQAGNLWAVPVIDLNSLSGLYQDASARYPQGRSSQKPSALSLPDRISPHCGM